MHVRLIDDYKEKVAAGQLRQDDAQAEAAQKLDAIAAALEDAQTAPRSIIKRLRRRETGRNKRGLYIWGGVGSGKSMLMDLFFARTGIKQKRRVHFHAFMQEVHQSLHKARQDGTPDPLAVTAERMAGKTRLLCFDELQITDITDAMIVGRLFTHLSEAGVFLVTTSNRVPHDLYKNGLNRGLFLPFIDFLNAEFDVHHLASDLDYRQDRLRGEQTYFTPLGPVADDAMERVWCDLTFGYGAALNLTVHSRILTIPRFHNGVGRASFDDLCVQSLGPADYLAIAKNLRVLLLENIPKLSPAANNEAKRFVTLIDTLYEAGTRLICSAEATPDCLYQTGTGAFEFARTASRLEEMQSLDWAR